MKILQTATGFDGAAYAIHCNHAEPGHATLTVDAAFDGSGFVTMGKARELANKRQRDAWCADNGCVDGKECDRHGRIETLTWETVTK